MQNYTVSSNKNKLDIEIIHDYLSNRAYWAKGRSIEQVQKSIENSICFGVYNKEGRQCGFARVVSDLAVYAYIMDVFILEEYRGQGLGKILIEHVVSSEELRDVTRWRLDTHDAHELYAKFGFTTPKCPERAMERLV